MKFVVILFFSLSFCIHYSLAVDDTLKPNQTLQDTGQTLVSTGAKFKLGFFSPPNSKDRYVGIWFNNIAELTPVWVENRDNPLTDSSGIFKITETGNIVILSNKTENPIWSSNSSAKDPTLQLLNTGNLVVRDGSNGNYTWQSFDHPCDSLIAGMKLGWDFKTGQNWKLNSWNNLQDPSTGIYTYEMDRNGIPQHLLRRGQDILYRNGPWDGVRSGGDPTPMRQQSVFIPKYVVNETHNYYTFDNADNSTLTRFDLNALGSPTQQRWDPTTASWILIFAMQKEDCDTFARCGPNGICVDNVCHCPTGFVPKAPEAWAAGNSSSGCILKTSLNCSANEGFKKFSKLKLPYNSEFTVNGTVVKKECELICRRNCSCVAYAVAKVGGCVVWSGELFDMRSFSVGGQDVYIRMDASELKSDENEKKRAVIIAVSVVSGFVLLFLVGGYIIRKRRRASRSHISQFDNAVTNSKEHEHPILLENDVDQLPSFDMDTISNATDNFSSTNKIGEGGFGPVYKGMLPTGQKIAVKRLSKDSGQGIVEFKNEVVLIAKLQHWNLVRLLGCYIQGEERMLIYEYMPNKSLDLYIFNQTRGTALNWPKRFDIIVGVARGLLYLHRDSRLRIIHRDLKASNILLDDEMNPKISDFGMARIFGGDQNEVNTNRVVGTYGYMSPEYVIDGHFSVKSDIFSFGVMVLEIVSGKKNRGFEHPDHEHNLLGHAWNLWNEGRPMELMDSLMENVSVSEVLRCIQVGLLCVQKRPEERPLMSFALSMLDSENASLPQPKQPGFYTERAFIETDSSSLLNKPNASTEITVTILQGR
ncbi:G-type lectin S-receptor-like serine/threonine-protein kinase At4g27290 isoform X1 [Morus notabilis]|uniref:G-type lectin S-receptor-like serine/threonine-protein kinase At4g27290 isoform X1 n=2 Tax=Morus notabilis TaxID=981085 RepID=UPI000CED66AE|nr:G-type lectin S-receptor-like serine/threonine-protein kinase At4g27290 isoform X1 [Morus notabilis]